MYKLIIKPFLFFLSPETAHHLATKSLKFLHFIPGFGFMLRKIYSAEDEKLKTKILGIEFPNPVGLAAGFDKDAKYFTELANFGFGFIEVGTVTPLPQSGNPKPRSFRLPQDEALINRMGFNNDGVLAAAKRLKKRNPKIIIGGNIGKNKNTPNENAIDDYEKCFRALYDSVDYFVVNVSSPNTPDLRALQDKEPLKKILSRLKKLNNEPNQKPETRNQKPILLKIAPDLTDEQLDDIIEIVLETKIDGVVATNTTISREELRTDKACIVSIGNGGLSGKPLTKRSTEVIKYLCEKSQNKFPVIGVGGIHSPDDAIEKLKAGASLIQIYTGFIYEGPGLVKRICKKMTEDG